VSLKWWKITKGIRSVPSIRSRLPMRFYVLHCFQKKSKQGIETPKYEMDLIGDQLKAAQAFAKGA
jgi:phage-related protein